MRFTDMTEAQAVALAEWRLARLAVISEKYGAELNRHGQRLLRRGVWDSYLVLHDAGRDERARELVAR